MGATSLSEAQRVPHQYNRELKHAHFSNAEGNRKGTFRMLGLYYLPDF